MEVRPATREPLHQDVRKIALEVAEVVRNVALDESEGTIDTGERIAGVDVRPRVVDYNGNASHEVTRDPRLRPVLAEEAHQIGQHAGAFN